MRYTSLLLFLGLTACPTGKPFDSADTGYETCCAFSCTDGTSGTVTFTVDPSDCDTYATDQCNLAGVEVQSSEFSEGEC